MNEQPIIIYTCVAGRYDRHLMEAIPKPGLRFVCFTDHPKHLQAPDWEIVEIESPERLTSGHDINRYHKFFPHRLFPDARWSIYIDGNIRFAGDWEAMVARVRDNGAGLGAFWHPNGHDLKAEIAACYKYSKFDRRDAALVKQQLALYAGRGIDLGDPIPTNNVLVRDHAAPDLDTAMSLWWSQLFEFSKRDQMSLTYCLAKTGVRWQPLDGEGGIDPALVKTIWHRPPLRKRIEKRLKKMLGQIPAG